MDPAFVEDIKRSVVSLPLETNAVTSVAARLSSLDAPAFAMLLKELARDNHAFRQYPMHGLCPPPQSHTRRHPLAQ